MPTLKFMGQLFEHLGFAVLGEWATTGEYHGQFKEFSLKGRLGNIGGRPSEDDLRRVAQQVRGALQA